MQHGTCTACAAPVTCIDVTNYIGFALMRNARGYCAKCAEPTAIPAVSLCTTCFLLQYPTTASRRRVYDVNAPLPTDGAKRSLAGIVSSWGLIYTNDEHGYMDIEPHPTLPGILRPSRLAATPAPAPIITLLPGEIRCGCNHCSGRA